MSADKSTLQAEYFGSRIEYVELYQLPMIEFNEVCLSSNSSQDKDFDSTGKRMYAGAHVAIRFLVAHPELLNGRTVVELGCGTGAVGLLANEYSFINRLLLTDGNNDTLLITKNNISKFIQSENMRVDLSLLIWGNDADISRAISLNDNKAYDVVIGCELMYYQTDIDLLLSTVMKLISKNGESTRGIFIHSHLFRRSGQEQELIDYLLIHNWKTLEVPHKQFLAKEELSYHPEWYRTRTLISGPAEVIDELVALYPKWQIFTAFPSEEDDEEDDEA